MENIKRPKKVEKTQKGYLTNERYQDYSENQFTEIYDYLDGNKVESEKNIDNLNQALSTLESTLQSTITSLQNTVNALTTKVNNYIGKVLFTGSTTGTVTLNETAYNYTYLDIEYIYARQSAGTTRNYRCSVRIPVYSGGYFVLNGINPNNETGGVMAGTSSYYLTGTTIVRQYSNAYEIRNDFLANTNNVFTITKVIGIK